MSAPVVRCWIDPESPDAVLAVGADLDLPALAVPDALWGDDAFIDALQARFGEPERRVWHRCLDAIHAELRERARGAA